MGANTSSGSGGGGYSISATGGHHGTATGHDNVGGGGGGGGNVALLMPMSGITTTAGATGSGGGPGGLTTSTTITNSSGGGGGGGTSGVAFGGAHYHREQRRKRVTGFATLKRKFIRRRRSSKACDHARVLRDFVTDWTPLELAALCEEYEALAALRDLSVQAELARPPATTYKQDLATLYDLNLCTDCDLVFRGSVFPVHRSVLSSRCTYFRDLLAGCPGFGARICLELPASPIDVQLFASLLRYLYTGDLCPHDPNIDVGLLRQLGDDFGTPNALEHDLRYLLETGDYADAALVFTADCGTNSNGGNGSGSGNNGGGGGSSGGNNSGNDYLRPDSGSSEYGFRPKLELPCHKAILSARSPFFRNLIARRTRNIDEYVERSLHVPTRIVLDETVIPKRYARVLLHAIYLDTVDLGLMLRGAGSGSAAGSLGEVHALTNTGRARPTPLEEAMELYQIGRFLELNIVAQGCEDLILEWLSLETLPTVLKWGCQPYGSSWVFRQACQYLREEFAAVSGSPVLHQLDKVQLVHVLQSNFLQASELEVLQAVLKWGEQELIRRMEDREPNLLSHTAHSVARKGVKKRDLSDVELREILSELLPLVRMDHVLPPHSDVLAGAIRRGLVSTPPSHMIGDERENLKVNAWIRGGKNQGLFVRPRLFMPYFEEVKALLEDRMASSHHQAELMRMRRARHLPDIPDTLYMVSRMNAAAAHRGRGMGHNHSHGGSMGGGGCIDGGGGGGGVDILAAAAAAAAIPPPDSQTLAAMRKREHKLRQSPMCQRALLLPLSSKHEIDRQIRLRVVREFNLPDEVSDLLESSLLSAAAAAAATVDHHHHHQQGNSHIGIGGSVGDDCIGMGGASSTTQTDDCLLEDDDQSPPPSPAAAGTGPRGHHHHHQQQQQHQHHHHLHLHSTSSTTATAASSFLSTSSMGSSAASSICGADATAQPCYSRNLTFPRHHVTNSTTTGTTSSGGGGGGGGSGGHLLGHIGLGLLGGGTTTSANYARLSASVHHRNDLPALITEGDYRFPHGSALGLDMGGGVDGVGGGGGACGIDGVAANGHLSDMMPDVAMATASLGQLHLANNHNNHNNHNNNHNNNNGAGQLDPPHGNNGGGNGGGGNGGNGGGIGGGGDMPESLQLDLGDGPSPHIMGGPSNNAMTLRSLQHHQLAPQSNYHHFMQRSNSPFDILRQGQHSPAPPQHQQQHPHHQQQQQQQQQQQHLHGNQQQQQQQQPPSSSSSSSAAGAYSSGPPRFL